MSATGPQYTPFPKVLCQLFNTVWDNKFPAQPWDDSTTVLSPPQRLTYPLCLHGACYKTQPRNQLRVLEGHTTRRTPTDKSYMECDCTTLCAATIYANTFKDAAGRTLKQQYVRPVLPGTFHSTVTSATGNQDETFALAIDQLPMLRSKHAHSSNTNVLDKTTFHYLISCARQAFQAVKYSTSYIDYISKLPESELPTGYVAKLKERVEEKQESPESWKWVKSSIVHREKFERLLEYAKEYSDEIKDINGVRVCCSKEFLIGRGSDGTKVYIGLGKDGYERAVKRLCRDDCASLAEQETEVLNATESNYVVKYWYLDDKSDKEWLFLIMDLYEESLKEFVERSSSDDLAKSAQTIIEDVLKGLADLHRDSKPILHRDLKPSNILRNVNGRWLLADFGISRIMTDDVSTVETKEWGTKHWKAAESTNGMPGDDIVRYKKKSDIQVAGMVAFYVVTKGEHPFGEEVDRLRNLLGGEPVGLKKLKDPAEKDLISWMLSHEPKDRPSAKEALKHPYFQPAKERFEMLCKMGNEVEIKRGDTKSDVVRVLNSELQDWRSLVKPDILNYISTDPSQGRKIHYRSSWTDCLRLIRNVKTHWNDHPRPRPTTFYSVGDPQEYFLNLFPNLPVVVHRIVRSCD